MTAVEWLLYHFDEIYHIKEKFLPTDWEFLEETSKSMEQKQIENAHLSGLLRPLEMEATKQAEQYYNETYGGHIVNTNEMVDQVPDVRKMVEDDVAPIDWLINQLENHIVLSAHNKLGTNRTGDYRIGLRKAIDFCHQAKEMGGDK